MALVVGVSGVYRICPISIGLRKAQAMAPPVVLTMSRYMFIQKGAAQGTMRRIIVSNVDNSRIRLLKIHRKSKNQSPSYIQASRGILNLSIISSLCSLSVVEGLDSDAAGSLEIPNRAMMPLLHNAREMVTNVAWVEMVLLCPLVIWGGQNKT